MDDEVARSLELGLPRADSIVDRSIPTFSRGELPRLAGINTSMQNPDGIGDASSARHLSANRVQSRPE